MAEKKQLPHIEQARELAQLGDAEGAVSAYEAALIEDNMQPFDKLEAACAVLQFGGDYKLAYDAFLDLYRAEDLRADVMDILTQAFYTPNINQQKNQYKKNCKILKRYPYIFRRDFPAFDELPVQFYPYDDDGVLPFYCNENRFGDYTNIHESVVRHYFFRDLSKPVLAEDIFSQYELEYLKDNVRRSDWVGYENHIYLCYSNWEEFCSWLTMLDLKSVLEDEKFVFLFGDEKTLYPIDFKERFGIDYSTYPVKPIGIREVHKIIWHTQFHAHSGGDFFNEILHEHPNIYAGDSLIFDTHMTAGQSLLDAAKKIRESNGMISWPTALKNRLGERILCELQSLHDITLKDAFVALYLDHPLFSAHLSPAQRIVPAFFFQPHFHQINFSWKLHPSGALELSSDSYDELKRSGLFDDFKYIKTFTPLRRPTTSCAATVRFMSFMDQYLAQQSENSGTELHFITDQFTDRIMNRSFMVAESDRVFLDSCLVRFEDGKLNPKATFTALAAFLDVPYTESMTYCSSVDGRFPADYGFRTDSVYNTYDEFCDHSERILIEYLLQDLYKAYGYEFQYYDGRELTQDDLDALLASGVRGLAWVHKSWMDKRELLGKKYRLEGTELDDKVAALANEAVERANEKRLLTVRVLASNLPFCSETGEKLTFMKLLELEPDLLEQPLYR